MKMDLDLGELEPTKPDLGRIRRHQRGGKVNMGDRFEKFKSDSEEGTYQPNTASYGCFL